MSEEMQGFWNGVFVLNREVQELQKTLRFHLEINKSPKKITTQLVSLHRRWTVNLVDVKTRGS